jgi:hypothetical protein
MKMFTLSHTTERIASPFDGHYLNHITRVTDDKTEVANVSIKTNEQSKNRMQACSPKKLKKKFTEKSECQ